MDETITTEVEVAEPEMDANDTVDSHNQIDDMSEEEFSEHFENMGTDTADKKVDETSDEPVDLDARYSEQIGDKESKLDKPILLKHNGTVMEVANLDELRNLAERGFNATQKFQKLSEDRKALEAQLQELGQEPNVEPVDESADEIESVATEILNSDYADTFQTDMQGVPQEVRDLLSGDAQLLRELSIDYKNGLGAQIMPKISRTMAVGDLSFRDAYIKIGNEILANQNRQTQAKPKAEMLKAQPKTNGRVSTELGKAAIDSMSDAEFNRYFADM